MQKEDSVLTIETALLCLSNNDSDMASDKNGVGYSARDVNFGHSLSDQVKAGRSLSPKQLSAALRMLRTYKTQLARNGIVLPDSIPNAEEPQEMKPIQRSEERKRKDETVVRMINEMVYIRAPYVEARVAAFKEIRKKTGSPGWSGTEWVFRMAAIPDLMSLVPIPPEILAAYNQMRDAGSPEVKLPTPKPQQAAPVNRVDQFVRPPKPPVDQTLIDVARELMDGLERQPFAHQREYVEMALGNNGNAICALDVGLGKTFSSLIVANVMAAKHGAEVWVVAPISVHENWRREAAMLGMEVKMISWAKIPDAPMYPFVLIMDECFPYHTKVATDVGLVSIGDIVEKGVGSKVLSYNTEHSVYEWKPITARARKPRNKTMVRVTHAHGSFVCTRDHKIWTEENGFIKAQDLISDQTLRTQAAKTRTHCLQELREGVLGDTVSVTPEVLLTNVLEQNYKPVAISQRIEKGECEICPESQDRNEVPQVGSAHEGSQPNGESRNTREDGSVKVWAISGDSRWERKGGNNSTADGLGLPWTRMDDRNTSSDRTGQRNSRRHPNIIQSGCREHSPEVGRGSGRELSSREAPYLGSEEGSHSCTSRVESVEAIEPNDYERLESCNGTPEWVYDLTVKDNHNYFADSVLVHNCHYIQHMKIKWEVNENSKKVMRITPLRTERALALAGSPYCYSVQGLTGTPTPNGRPAGLYPMLKAVKHWLSANKRDYERVFCLAGPTRWSKWDVSGVPGPDVLKRLNEFTSDALFRRKKTECSDLPVLSRNMRPIELSASAAKTYEETVDRLRKEWEDRVAKREISSANEALVTLGQLFHAVSVAKVESTVELVKELIDTGNQVLVGFMFKDSLEQVERALDAAGIQCGIITGETATNKRQPIVDSFQNGVIKVVLGTHGAMGVGLNLQAGDYVVLHDRPWRPGDVEQFEGRSWRTGRKMPVISVWPQANGTDRAIDAVLEKKQANTDLIIDGKEGNGFAIDIVIDGKRTILPNFKESIGEIASDLVNAILHAKSASYSQPETETYEEEESEDNE